MKISRSKVVIIGSGAVGATTAYSLVVQGVAAEVVLVDLNQEKAGGEALDMQHSMWAPVDMKNVQMRTLW